MLSNGGFFDFSLPCVRGILVLTNADITKASTKPSDLALETLNQPSPAPSAGMNGGGGAAAFFCALTAAAVSKRLLFDAACADSLCAALGARLGLSVFGSLLPEVPVLRLGPLMHLLENAGSHFWRSTTPCARHLCTDRPMQDGQNRRGNSEPR